jgi:dTDP-4-amino-4,6-dideoxygalactose transaminase
MRLHGISRDVFERYTSKKPSWFYEVVEPGFKYNMTDVAASMGIHQLKKAWAFREKRASIAAAYAEAFKDLPVVLPALAPEGETHAWHLFILRLAVQAPVSRDRFIEKMAEKGIGTSVHFIPLHLHPYWRERYALKSEDYPNATKAFEAAISLPIYTRMTEEDIQRVIHAVREILG